MAFIFRASRLRDAEDILPHVREEDVEEWDASIVGGLPEYLEDSIRQSLTYGECITVEDGDTNLPLVIVGVTPDPGSRWGTTWMVLSKQGAMMGMAIMYRHPEELDGFFRRWPNTVCFSHCKNLLHHRWLTYVGYHRAEEASLGPRGEGFIRFVRGLA